MTVKNRVVIFLIHNLIVIHLNAEENMIRDMLVMVAGQYAGSVANQMVTQEFDDLQKSLTKSQTNLSTAINSFGQKMQTEQSKQLHTTFYLFQQASNTINKLLSNQQIELQQMLNYIQATVSQQVAPLQNYLQNAATFDQSFAVSAMYTPRGTTWRNIYPVGNWEYDETTDSFWQMSMVPMMQKNSSGVASADYAINNSIFTEWITRQQSYQIECEFSVYQISYPFFIGLIFNKARWVSGDVTCLQKYRLLGLYATASNQFALCFAEAISEKNDQGQITWTFPLEQILEKVEQHTIPMTLPSNLIQNSAIQPIVVRLKIVVSQGQIQCKFWPITEKEPTKYIIKQTQNADLFLYHGIGFMAPGCLAQCKLLKPEELLFEASAQNQFKSEVATMVQDRLSQQSTKSIDALAIGVGT
ncbi:hypothetical protein KAZ82_01195 [Candidatus Babeliales bacterium]|nr:hypothetical protein [Candidatus Babeliales bacterium]